METNKKVVEFLRLKREELKIPRRVVADRLCMTPQSLRDIECGRSRLSLDNFLIICDVLNIQPMELIKKTNEHYVLLTDQDLELLDKSIDLLTKIKKHV